MPGSTIFSNYPNLRRAGPGPDWDYGTIPLNKDFSCGMVNYNQMIIIYRNYKAAKNFLPTSMLKASLIHLVTTYYPPVAGWIDADNNDISLVWNRKNMNMPVFTTAFRNMTYHQLLSETTRCGDIFVHNLPTEDITESNKRHPLLLVKVTRLKDNSAIALGITFAHILIDGAAFCVFVSNWAYMCKQMISGIPLSKTEIACPPAFGSLELDRFIGSEPTHFKHKEFIRLPKPQDEKATKDKRSRVTVHRRYVSPSQQKKLRKKAHDIKISFSNYLCALLCKEMCYLRLLHSPEIASERTAFGTIVDVRKHFGVPIEFCSNAIIDAFTDEFTTKEISDMDIEDVGVIINNSVKRMTANFLVGAFGKMHSMLDEAKCDAGRTGQRDLVLRRLPNIPGSLKVTASVFIHFPSHMFDFGTGVPAGIIPHLEVYDGAVRIWPTPPNDKGESDLEMQFLLDKSIDVTMSAVLNEFASG